MDPKFLRKISTLLMIQLHIGQKGNKDEDYANDR